MTELQSRLTGALLALAALTLILAPAVPAAAAEKPATTVDQIEYPPLPAQEVPQPTRVELDNGMVVMLLEDHELPLVDAFAFIRTGSRLEPADKVGLANLTGDVLRTGGTESMSSQELDEFLENRAASVETSIGVVQGQASMSSLADDFPEVLEVFADVLRNPTFEEDKLEVAKTQANAAIARQNDNPQSIVFREFSQVVYGEDSPYARDDTYETIANVTRDDLVAWHQRYFHPNRVILGLVGDFDSDEALERVRSAFGDWERGPAVPEDEGDVPYRQRTEPGVYYVDKSDMTQSNIVIGHLGVTRDNPDWVAIEVMNQVLSGGFASRLFSNVRSAKGLAYAVAGGVGANFDYPGLLNLFTTTKTETTGAAIEALIEEAENMTAEPPSEEEVAKAKQGILNSFVFESDSNREILVDQLRYEYHGLPLDYQERFRRGVEETTVAEVREAAEKYIHPDRFAIVVVGPREGMDKPLSTYGEVHEVDISIPEPAAEKAEVTEEGEARARELLDRAVDAMGGPEVVDSVEALATTGSATQKTPQGDMEIGVSAIQVFPSRLRQELTLPFGSITMVVGDDSAFMLTPQGTQDLPASRVEALRRAALRDPLALLKMRHDPDFTATALEPGELDGTPLERLQIEVKGDVVVVGLDPETYRIRQIVYRESGPGGAPGEATKVFSDYRDVEGLNYPFATVGTFDGEQISSSEVEEIELDPEVEEGAFDKPEE